MLLPIYVFNNALEIGEGTWPMICAYSDNTNVVFKVDFDPSGYGYAYNQFYKFATDFWSTWYDDNTWFTVGRYGSSGKDGAIRFESVPLTASEGLDLAKIEIYTNGKLGDTSKHIRWHTYGIKETNTGSFNNPMGRTKTTAYSNNDRTVPLNYGDFVEIDVLNQVNEIRGMSGWAKDNAMGFLMNEDGSDNDALFGDAIDYTNTYLKIIKSGTIRLYFKAVVLTEKIV
jgi:hypothetical protein